MRTLKTILIMSMLMVLTTSCTDLTEDLVPNTTETTELVSGFETNSGDTDTTTDGTTSSQDTGGTGDGDGGTGKGGE